MIKKMMFVVLAVMAFGLFGCKPLQQSADQKQARAQEAVSEQADAECGMPAISNFTEKKTMKMILEKRDQAKLVTYAYVYSPMLGKFTFLGTGYGFPLPYATQYTNPQRLARYNETPSTGNVTLPQADPTRLFSPATADATWWLYMNPKTKTVEATYFEEKINVVPFELPDRIVIK